MFLKAELPKESKNGFKIIYYRPYPVLFSVVSIKRIGLLNYFEVFAPRWSHFSFNKNIFAPPCTLFSCNKWKNSAHPVCLLPRAQDCSNTKGTLETHLHIFLANRLTLFQLGGQIMPTTLLLAHPDLKTWQHLWNSMCTILNRTVLNPSFFPPSIIVMMLSSQ